MSHNYLGYEIYAWLVILLLTMVCCQRSLSWHSETWTWWDVHHTRWCIMLATSFDQGKIIRPFQYDQIWSIRDDGDVFGTWHNGCLKELDDTRDAHARFGFLENLYTHHLDMVVYADGEHAMYHRACALRSYLIYLVGPSIFMDNNAFYVDVVYLRYFIDLERIHEYSWGITCLVYLYSKLSEDFLWKTKQMTTRCTLFTVIYLNRLLLL